MKKKDENHLQHTCWVWFRNNYGLKHHNPRCEFVSVPNEMARGNLNIQAMGIRKGASDCYLILPNKVVFIEFKTLKGTQRIEQSDFEESVLKLGFKYYIVRSLKQFQEIVEYELQN